MGEVFGWSEGGLTLCQVLIVEVMRTKERQLVILGVHMHFIKVVIHTPERLKVTNAFQSQQNPSLGLKA